MKKINLKIKFPRYNSTLILTVVLILALAWEAFIGYKYLYKNLSPGEIVVPPANIVRLNKQDFDEMVAKLNLRQNYQLEPYNIKRPSPF